MKFLVNNGAGYVDYTSFVDPTSIQLTDAINVPTTVTFTVSNHKGSFVPPVRGAYVRIVSETKFNGAVPFVIATGFIANEPVRAFLGMTAGATGTSRATQFQLYQWTINVVSDEWLLNVKSIPFIPAFINQGAGQILASLADILCPGIYNTALVVSGDLIPYFQYDPTKATWSDTAKAFGDSSRFWYKVIDKQIYYQPYNDAPLGIVYNETLGQSTFDPTRLNSGVLTVPPVNDAIVLGDTEPQTMREDNFIGNGFDTNFKLHHKTFHASSAQLLVESWNETDDQFQTNVWNVYEFGSLTPAGQNSIFHLVGALNAILETPGSVLGDNAIVGVNGVELGGSLDYEHGEFQFNDITDGLMGGIYPGFGAGGNAGLTKVNCLAGFEVSSTNGITATPSGAIGVTIQPVYNGASVGPVVTTKINCSYILQTLISNERYDRYVQVYRTLAGDTFGGHTVDKPASVTFMVTEVDLAKQIQVQEGLAPFTNIVAPLQALLTQFTVTGANIPAFGVYAPLNITDANVTVTQTSINQTPQGALYVRNLVGPTGGLLPIMPQDLQDEQHHLLGFGFENQRATISQGSGNVDQLQFYNDSVPAVGARIRFETWAAGVAMGRVRDPVDVAKSALLTGDDGVRLAIFTSATPKPRTSEECEHAAAAIIMDREGVQYQGQYDFYDRFLLSGITGYPIPGRMLYINAPGRGINGLNLFVNSVSMTVDETRQEIFEFSVQFGPDLYLEKVLHPFLQRTDNLLVPQEGTIQPNFVNIDELATKYLPDLTSARAIGISGTQVYIDLGEVPVTGAEVRRTDTGWGKPIKNLVGIVTSQTFTLPRYDYDQTWYIRQVNGGKFSRRAKAIRVAYPRVPLPPGAQWVTDNTFLNQTLAPGVPDPMEPVLQLDFGANDLRNVYGAEIRDITDNSLVGGPRPIVAPQDLLFTIDNSVIRKRDWLFVCRFFNLMWEYSDPTFIDFSFPVPTVSGLAINGIVGGMNCATTTTTGSGSTGGTTVTGALIGPDYTLAMGENLNLSEGISYEGIGLTHGLGISDSYTVQDAMAFSLITIGIGGTPETSKFFGMQLNSLNDPWPNQPVGAWRLWDTGTNWYQIETAQGVFDFSRLDNWLDATKANNITDVMFAFGRVPTWANGTSNHGDPPTDVDSGNAFFIGYVTAVVNHNLARKAAGKGYITRWELWNEPYVTNFWTGTPLQLFKMTQAGANVIRSLDANAILHGVILASAHTYQVNFLDSYLGNSGVLSLFDACSWHYYTSTGQTPDNIITQASAMRAYCSTKGLGSKPLFLTETGPSINNNNVPANDTALAAYVAGTYLAMLGVGMAGVYWYMWDIQVPLQGNAGGVAFGRIQNWVQGCTVQSMVQDGNGAWRTTYRKPDTSLIQVIWNNTGTATSTVTPYTHWQDANGGSGTVVGGTLSVGSMPVLLTP